MELKKVNIANEIKKAKAKVSKTDKAFIKGNCELRNGFYIIPRHKFTEDTPQLFCTVDILIRKGLGMFSKTLGYSVSQNLID